MSKIGTAIALVVTISVSALSFGQNSSKVKLLIQSEEDNGKYRQGILRFAKEEVQFIIQDDQGEPPELAIRNEAINSLHYESISKRRLDLQDLRTHPERLPFWWLCFFKSEEHVLTIRFHDQLEHERSAQLLLGKDYKKVLKTAQDEFGPKIEGALNEL